MKRFVKHKGLAPQQDPPIAIKRKSKATSQGNSNFIKNHKKNQQRPLSFYLDRNGVVYYER